MGTDWEHCAPKCIERVNNKRKFDLKKTIDFAKLPWLKGLNEIEINGQFLLQGTLHLWSCNLGQRVLLQLQKRKLKKTIRDILRQIPLK